MAEVHIFSITFNKLDVFRIILALVVNKAHHHDNISLRMIKLCTNAVALYLLRYFKIMGLLVRLLVIRKKQILFQCTTKMVKK